MKMKTKAILWIAAFLFSTGSLFAVNSTPATASVVRPDGSAVTEDFATAGGSTAWFQAQLTATHCYVAEVEAPFNGVGTLGGASPTMTVTVTQAGGTPITVTDISNCAPATGSSGKRVTFRVTAADVAGGDVKIGVTNGIGSNYTFRFRLHESGLYCPRWSVNSYVSLIDLQNTTDCTVSIDLYLYKSDGSVASLTPVVLNPNGATQIQITPAMANGALFGSSAIFHNGPKGAVTGGIYQVNAASAGANFLWQYVEIRSHGATSGQ